MLAPSVRVRLQLDVPHVTCAKVLPCGTLIAAATAKGLVYIFSAQNGRLRSKFFGHSRGISDVCWLPNLAYLASGLDDNTVKIWSLKDAQCVRTLKGHYYSVTCVRFNHKGNLLISGSSDEAIRVWDVFQGRCLKTLSAHLDPIACVDVCWDGSVLVSGSYDGLIRFFDVLLGQCLKTLMYEKTDSSFPISYVRFSPNGKYLLASSLDGVIRLWDYTTAGKVVKTYSYKGGVAEKYSCSAEFLTAFERPQIVLGSECGKVLFWDLDSKQLVLEIDVGGVILQVDCIDGGRGLCVASMDGKVVYYDLDYDQEKDSADIDTLSNGGSIELQNGEEEIRKE